MKFLQWLRPGIGVKRWIFFAIFGILLVMSGIMEILLHMIYTTPYKILFSFMIICGAFIIYLSVVQCMKTIIVLINKGYLNLSLNSKKLENLIYEKRLLVKGPKIVVIGGGTGLSNMLRGLKYYTSNITAIVTVADDGGGSGVLREDLGILPPGDIRNCILALSDTEPIMEELLQYRFKEGRLRDQSFGNLFLAAMTGISNNFEEAVRKMSSVLAVTGKVMPVTLDNVTLKARLKNGKIIEGESYIPRGVIENNSPIDKMFIEPENARALSEAVDAIMDADAIILGPGSLYTSVIPNLLVKEIANAINKTKALRIYVANIMTQRGETDNFSVSDHIKAIFRHAGNNIIDYVVANVGKIDPDLEKIYMEEISKLVEVDEKNISDMNVNFIGGDFIKIKNKLIRHDPEKLSSILIETIMEKKLLFDRKKIIEYFYLSERLKQNKSNKLARE